MLHILHTADWQIGRQYGSFDGEDASVLSEARLEVVDRIAKLACERQADIVLVAGDVFDMQEVSERTIRRLFASLKTFAGPWVLLAGNHDAQLADGVWQRARRLGCIPERVHVPQALAALEFPELNLAVLAAPLCQRQTHEDVTVGMDTLDSARGAWRVGLAHGSVTGVLPASVDAHNPIAADRAARARLDYLALGDWHGCKQINARTWYAGTPEQDRFSDNAPGHVLSVRLSAAEAPPNIERIAVGRFKWTRRAHNLVVASDVEALAHALKDLGPQDVVRLDLTGSLGMQGFAALREVLGAARGRLRVLKADEDSLAMEPEAADLAALGTTGYVGEVAVELQTMAKDPQQGPVAAAALKLLMTLSQELAHEDKV